MNGNRLKISRKCDGGLVLHAGEQVDAGVRQSLWFAAGKLGLIAINFIAARAGIYWAGGRFDVRKRLFRGRNIR